MITVSNRQKLRRVDTQLLKKIAARAMVLVGAASPPRPGRQIVAGTPLLHIVLVDDAEIAKLNRQFHDTDGPTDILTFDYGDEAELIISVETAIRQARRYRSTPVRELALYVVHGILHLSGYDDRTPRQRARMRAAERRVVAGCKSRVAH